MRHLLLLTFLLTLCLNVHGQYEDDLSKSLAKGMAELRQDIFKRKQAYTKALNGIVSRLDSSSIKEGLKKEIHEFIKQDITNGARMNSLEFYDLVPKTDPYKNIYVEQYIANNQDFQIDKDLIKELTENKILTPSAKINREQLEELKQEIDFMKIKENDRLLLYNDWGARYTILLGYGLEGIDLTIHNQYLNNHYIALDRLDRYPNINNGNVIEFLQNDDARIMVKGERWDKIIIRETTFLEGSAGYILKSLHDNISKEGHLFIFHDVANGQSDCSGKLKEENIIKKMLKADFKVIDKLESECQTYFKFQSIKE